MTIKPLLELLEWSILRFRMKKLRVLVVEDNPDDIELLAFCLRKYKVYPKIAHNAEAAIALIEQNNLDIIFVDMRLPYMPGWELIRIIRQHSPESLIVGVMGDVSDVQRIEWGDQLFLLTQKPPTVEWVRKLLRRFKP